MPCLCLECRGLTFSFQNLLFREAAAGPGALPASLTAPVPSPAAAPPLRSAAAYSFVYCLPPSGGESGAVFTLVSPGVQIAFAVSVQ